MIHKVGSRMAVLADLRRLTTVFASDLGKWETACELEFDAESCEAAHSAFARWLPEWHQSYKCAIKGS